MAIAPLLFLASLAQVVFEPQVTEAVPSKPVVWAIGLNCGERPIGVYLIHSDGTPRWVSVDSATKADVATVRHLASVRQLTTQEVCRGFDSVEPGEEQPAIADSETSGT